MRRRVATGRVPRGFVLLAALWATVVGVWPHRLPTAHAEVPQVSRCVITDPLSPGASGPQVACLQFFLGLLGIYTGELTAGYDDLTGQAVADYQRLNPPLAPDGVATVQTLTAMGLYQGAQEQAAEEQTCTADADIAPGDAGPSAVCIQQRLAALGVYLGEPTGVYDAATIEAVKFFQSKNPPLAVDGAAGPRTLAAMGVWSGAAVGDDPAVSPTGGTTGVPAQRPFGSAAAGPWPAPQLDYPEFRLTPQGIPFYGNRGICTVEDANTIAAQFAHDDADVTTQQWAVYIASREGGCNYQTVNNNPATRDDSHCTFQLNALAGMFEAHGELGRRGWSTDSVKSSMQACADAASDLWVYCGKGPWTPPYRCLQPWENDLGPIGDE